MQHLGAICDDFYVSIRLFLRLELSPSRETLLNFFDRMRRVYPRLRKMRRREDGAVLLEEDVEEGEPRRWVRIDSGGLRLGCSSPTSSEDVRDFARVVAEQAPYYLTLSDIDFDHLEIVYGFDLEYRGNHDQLVAETFSLDQPAASFLFGDKARHVLDAQPYMGIALTPECDLQAYIEIKSRTNTYEVRQAAYEPRPITVFLTLRRYWGVPSSDAPATQGSFEDVLSDLFDHADELAQEKIVPLFVNPLAAAIASRS